MGVGKIMKKSVVKELLKIAESLVACGGERECGCVAGDDKSDWLTVSDVEKICSECAENMKRAGISRVKKEALSDGGRIAYGWSKLPKGWTQESVKKFWNKLTGDKKHKVSECINKMKKHLGDGAGGFCAGMADMADPQGPSWRFGPRKKKNSSIAFDIITSSRVLVDMDESVKIPSQLRRKANRALQKVLKPVYFKEIPLSDIFDAINHATDLVVIQEDGKEWSGFLIGRSDEATFQFGYRGKLVSNSGLRLSWYKMRSGKYEITGYIF